MLPLPVMLHCFGLKLVSPRGAAQRKLLMCKACCAATSSNQYYVKSEMLRKSMLVSAHSAEKGGVGREGPAASAAAARPSPTRPSSATILGNQHRSYPPMESTLMANNRMYLRNTRTGKALMIAKYYPSTGWSMVKEAADVTAFFREQDFGCLTDEQGKANSASPNFGVPYTSSGGMYGAEWTLYLEQE